MSVFFCVCYADILCCDAPLLLSNICHIVLEINLFAYGRSAVVNSKDLVSLMRIDNIKYKTWR